MRNNAHRPLIFAEGLDDDAGDRRFGVIGFDGRGWDFGLGLFLFVVRAFLGLGGGGKVMIG